MIFLSIIIPVYNVEKYVHRCLYSIYDQVVEKNLFEVIVVNDESTDNSMRIVKEIKNHHENLTIINQNNKGLSSARNTGINNAKGKYIWFVDSDDYIVPGCLKKMIDSMEKDSPDILTFNYSHPHEDNDIIDKTELYKEEKIYSNTEDFFCTQFSTTAWSKVYNLNFLKANSLKFLEGVIYEDQEFTPRAYFFAEKIKCDPIFAYNYFHRKNSITTDNRTDRSINFVRVIDSLYDFKIKNIEKNSNVDLWFNNKISFLFSQSLKFNKTSDLLTILKKKPYYPLSFGGKLSFKEKFKYQLINFNLYIYNAIYNLT